MTIHFERPFQNLDPEALRELETLELEGAIYDYLWADEHNRFVFVRLQLTPTEIVSYVEALTSYNEFLGLYNTSGDPSSALKGISSSKIRRRVDEYNEWTLSIGQPDTQYCLAAFLGEHLESLLCGIVADRHEILGLRYAGDRRYLLREVLDTLPSAVASAQEHGGHAFPLSDESRIRSLLFLVLKCIFPDARLEDDPTPKHAGSSKRIDIVLPSISVVLEAKFVRDSRHARFVASELKVDIESYHAHPSCKTLLAFVWDPDRLLPDRENFIADLHGRRTKGDRTFSVEVMVKP
jgi:hypothetical protein